MAAEKPLLTYGARKVVEVLKSLNISYRTYQRPDEKIWELPHHSAVVANLNSSYNLSIQTVTIVTWGSFCETALMDVARDSITYNDQLGYSDVLKFEEPSELKEHLIELLLKLSSTSVAATAAAEADDDEDDDDIDRQTKKQRVDETAI